MGTSAVASTPVRVGAGTVFAAAWGVANLVHLLNQQPAEMGPAGWANVAAALWLLSRPGSAHRLALLAGVQVLDTLWVAPREPDHQLLACFVNIAVLLAYARRRRPGTSDELLEHCAPAARLLLLVGYGAAALAKWNTSFLEPATSCATYLAHAGSFGLAERTGPAAGLAVAGALAVESLVPVLLLVPATRRFGVLLGASFHFVVSASPAIAVADFTFTVWALYLLFLPAAMVGRLGARVQGWFTGPTVRLLSRKPLLSAAGVLLAFAALAHGSPVLLALFLWLFTAGVGALLLLTLFRVVLTGHDRPVSLGRPTAGQLAVVVGMVAMVVGPYLGLGTSSRFTMFSGLRTEGVGTNHLFLPSVHVIDSQNEYVVVLEAAGDSRFLEQAADAQAAIPLAQLEQELAEHPEAGGRFRYDDEVVEVRAGRPHALRRVSAPWWERKTQHYRAFAVPGVSDPGFCSN